MLPPYSAIGVLHIRRGNPWISAEHDPHLAALQFQRTARSEAMLACTQRTASSTTIPSRTGTVYDTRAPPLASPRQILSSRLLGSITRSPPACTSRRSGAAHRRDGEASAGFAQGQLACRPAHCPLRNLRNRAGP